MPDLLESPLDRPPRLRASSAEAAPGQDVLNEAFSVAYEELRRLAASVRGADPGATLNPTALVNEAWLKLSASSRLSWASPLHFKHIAARAMRQLLVESARRRHALKRQVALVTFDEPLASLIRAQPVASEEEFLRLDGALEELSKLSTRQVAIVESRFFGGLGVEDTARVLNVSEATVQREWRAARAWLGRELRRAS